LVETALAAGTSEEDAQRQADSLLGKQDDIVSEMLAREELKSWTARWPWALYGVMPSVILVASVALVIYLVVAITQIVTLISGEFSIVPVWVVTATDVLRFLIMYASPMLLGGVICYIAIHRCSYWLWPGFEIVLVATAARISLNLLMVLTPYVYLVRRRSLSL
jgi:hypothetical protein